MFSRVVPLGIAAVAATVLAAPAALACENPDDIIIALRDVAPEAVEPGEVVLELDRDGMEIIKAREEVIKFDKPTVVSPTGEPGETEMRFDVSYATFRVVRVLQGDFTYPVARINVSLWSTCKSIGGPQRKFVVGWPMTDSEGIPYIKARWLKAAEFDAQNQQDRGDKH